ncbi:hypothetical protein [Streptomyces sp. NPDC057554]|uniref:hypothetical protein n=1 Tax=Streptomyces sp. NPDC057554 TaxID=3350538 RepID=UPI00369B68CF
MDRDVHRVEQNLLGLLRRESARRDTRPGFRTHGQETAPAWVFTERALLLEAINTERARRALPAVTLEDVREVEMTALGHADYAQKLSWRCAELALGQAHS